MRQRRAEILSAARACFVRHGVASTSVKAIAREAGVSIGGLYVHFSSKGAIVEALFADADRQNAEATRPPIAQVVQQALRHYGTAPGRDRARRSLVFHAEAARDPDIERLARQQLLDVRASLAPRDDPDAHAAAALAIAIVEGFKIQRVLDPELDLDACARAIGPVLTALATLHGGNEDA